MQSLQQTIQANPVQINPFNKKLLRKDAVTWVSMPNICPTQHPLIPGLTSFIKIHFTNTTAIFRDRNTM